MKKVAPLQRKKKLYAATVCLKSVTDTYKAGFFNGGSLIDSDILKNIWNIVDNVTNAYDLHVER